MTKKKKIVTIVTASVAILIILLLAGFLTMHFISASNPNYNYIQQFNHKYYNFESSDNDELTTILSKGHQNDQPAQFYLMSMGNQTIFSSRNSKAITYGNAKTSTTFSINNTTITLNDQMIVTSNDGSKKYSASIVQFLHTENKMQIEFTQMTTRSTATAIFKFLR